MAGGAVGALAGPALPDAIADQGPSLLGLLTLALGVRMTLAWKDFGRLAGVCLAGALIGLILQIDAGIEAMADGLRSVVRGGSGFGEGFVAASVLFCVGPVTVLGSLQEGLEGRRELVLVKTMLDGIAALALSAALGWGVFFSFLSVLAIQLPLALGARRLEWLRREPLRLQALEGVGGVAMLAIGLRLIGAADFPTAALLPAIAAAPWAAAQASRPSKASSDRAG
jgi:uncharacterized membrane protein YqgA involved in biofilm formation